MNNHENLSIKDIKKLYKKYFNSGQVSLLSKLSFSNETILRAKGCYLFTKNGEKIFDMTSGFGTQNLGYNDKEIANARIEFIKNENLPFSRLFFDKNIALLSQKISSLLPGELQYSFFSNSGAEANEGALKLAYKYHLGKRTLLLHNKNSFHGKLIATSQITDSPEVYFKFQEALNSIAVDLNNIEEFKKSIEENKNNIYAIILEPFSASLADSISLENLLEIQRICNQEDILVIYDEVYSGFFRTGELFYFLSQNNLIPDIVTYSKSFGGGISSISGYTAKKEIFIKSYGNQKDALLHSSTYSNYVEEVAIALKTLEIISQQEFILQIEKSKKQFQDSIFELNDIKTIETITGQGFHFGIKMKKQELSSIQKLINIIPLDITKDERFFDKLYISAIINELYFEYKILSYAGFNKEIKLIVSPPVIINSEEIDFVNKSLRNVLSQKPLTLISKFIKNYLIK